MDSKNQLALWLYGIPVHNLERDECCPDFSCCNGLMTPRFFRQRFYEATDEERWKMLGGFLIGALSVAAPEVKVHFAGDPANEHEVQ